VTTGLHRVKSLLKNTQLMLYREITPVCSEIHTKHINTVWVERRTYVYKEQNETTGL